jgi:hypothetical protein
VESTTAVLFPSIFPDGTEGPEVYSLILRPTPVKTDNLNLPIDAGWFPKEEICAGDVDTAVVPACA